MVYQKTIVIPAKKRGFHLIDKYFQELELPQMGVMNLFIQHTSAALTINENADPSVKLDFESFISKLIPENDPLYTHLAEGEDDMPAHIKSSLFGSHVSIPISNGKLNLGTWQGIYLCEFRNQASARKIVVTVIG